MLAQEPLGHEVELAFERLAVVGRELLRGSQSAHLDVGERGEGLAIQLVDATPGAQQRQVLRVAQVLHDHEASPQVRCMHMGHVRTGLLQQRRHLQIGRDVFLARRRVHHDQGIGPRRPARRIDVTARHAEIAAKAGVRRSDADAAHAPSQVTCQPGPNESEARVVLEHSY
jgi:hypothetical protein